VLIGALTVLVTIVAVYLAYNASNGLPFVPTYTLHVQAANASELTHGDNVNMGGALVGFVSTVTPTRLRDGRPIALINVQLQKSIEPLPVDSKFTVRLKGAIGLKYLAITLGHASRGFPDKAVVPIRQEGTEVDFDQVLSMFTPATRVGVRQSTIGLGQALAGRGYDINNAIGAFGPLLRDLQPVAANLASPNTNLAGFFRSLETTPARWSRWPRRRGSSSSTSTPPSGLWPESRCHRCRRRSPTHRRCSTPRSPTPR
jgi:ABC-type transporter Mla subunit MlaD